MKNKSLDSGLPTPEKFAEELENQEMTPELRTACLEEYTKKHTECVDLLLSGDIEGAEKIRNELKK